MKYKVNIEINGNINEVKQAFTDPNFAFKWMENLQEYNIGHSTNELIFKNKDKITIMKETIEINNLPELYKNTYYMDDTKNFNTTIMKSKENTVNIELETEFKFLGFMGVIAPLFKFIFKKQTKKNLNNFKTAFEQEYK